MFIEANNFFSMVFARSNLLGTQMHDLAINGDLLTKEMSQKDFYHEALSDFLIGLKPNITQDLIVFNSELRSAQHGQILH